MDPVTFTFANIHGLHAVVVVVGIGSAVSVAIGSGRRGRSSMTMRSAVRTALVEIVASTATVVVVASSEVVNLVKRSYAVSVKYITPYTPNRAGA